MHIRLQTWWSITFSVYLYVCICMCASVSVQSIWIEKQLYSWKSMEIEKIRIKISLYPDLINSSSELTWSERLRENSNRIRQVSVLFWNIDISSSFTLLFLIFSSRISLAIKQSFFYYKILFEHKYPRIIKSNKSQEIHFKTL